MPTIMDQLPIELCFEIARHDSDTFNILARAYPKYGRLTLAPNFINIFKTKIGGNTCLFGKLHSFDDKPTRGGSCKYWYKYGIIHRSNGLPAIIIRDVEKRWVINGKHHREHDLPAWEHANGALEWFLNGLCHRDNDLPAYISSNKTYMEWRQHGFLHRENDRPAKIINGVYRYFRDGIRYNPDN